MIRAILLASATATTLKGRLARSALSHGGALALPLMSQDRSGAKYEKGAQHRIAHLRDPAEPLLATARMGLRR